MKFFPPKCPSKPKHGHRSDSVFSLPQNKFHFKPDLSKELSLFQQNYSVEI